MGWGVEHFIFLDLVLCDLWIVDGERIEDGCDLS